ncbi:signal peptidase I (plasmid) [Xanthomonas citri pv. citri]|uniref:signal peptidase I n=1 Tax=Xanthomonas citri TaxID=346 RepID=UPI0019314466|nr:signal peptidase I [Xanthomonas citri]QRD62626.1 signal peptidase I [Xanthomonas citri pv. citri]QRD67161.1 signal peptidase I [Xanthomonas citri pv. citri]QRD71794.1 signal peptidase I [Xanthomonas citri pv. citri]
MTEAAAAPRRWSPRFTKNLIGASLLIALTGATYVQATYAVGLDLQSARCLPWVAYLIKKNAVATVERGDVYALRFGGDSQLENRTLLKIAAGLPGDAVQLDRRGVWINNRYWGPMHPAQVDRLVAAGRNPFTNLVIPPGKLLMLGTLPQSYDSRYVGLIDRTAIEGKAVPLW